jgi:hypothetical protein
MSSDRNTDLIECAGMKLPGAGTLLGLLAAGFAAVCGSPALGQTPYVLQNVTPAPRC